MKAALVLRPEPGNTRTAARLRALGVAVTCQPLFAVTAVAWTPPAPDRFDALMLTSANAVRHAGAALASLAGLPVVAVGSATARAATAAGLTVVLTGERDAAALVAAARARGYSRLLHLAGHHRVSIDGVLAITTYRSVALPVPPGATQAWHHHVALLHSARAARRLADLFAREDRARVAVAALSAGVAAAAGDGWAATLVAPAPTDTALVRCAAALIDPPGRPADKGGP